MRLRNSFLGFGCLVLSLAAIADADPSVLHRKLQESEATVRDLQKRVEILERLVGNRTPTPAARSTTIHPDPKLDGQLAARPSNIQTAPVSSPEAPSSTSKIEEDETVRALERALVREGGFLLPRGSFELEPRLQYSYRGTRGLGIVSVPSGLQIVNRETKHDRFEGTLGLRAGLPWAAQAELRVPYVWTQQTGSAAAVGFSESQRQSGLGDAELQVTKQLIGERGNHPALLASLNLKTTSGHFSPGRLSSGSGFVSWQGAITAVKRQDPLVFVGSVSYIGFRSREFNDSKMDPGDGIGIRFSTILAASPETSLRAGLDFSRYGKTRINGTGVPGSDLVNGVIELGVSTLLSSHTLLDLNVGFGVTPDAPNLRISMSLPIRAD